MLKNTYFLQNGGAMMNHSKPLLDAPIPATVPVTAAPSAPEATSKAAQAAVLAVVALPQPLLPTSQGQETKQERAERSQLAERFLLYSIHVL